MHKLRWVLLSALGWLLLLACSAETITPTATTLPPPSPKPTIAATESSATATEPSAVAPQGATLNGYTNVLYTEDNGFQIGQTGHAQLINVYATW